MPVELVRVTTTDGHRLDGSFSAPVETGWKHPGVDACLMLHGVGGNFYSGNLFDFLGNRLVDSGIAVLRVNTRGHDSISITWSSSGAIRQGAAYEIVDACRLDVAAWLAMLQDRGFTRIALLGHSLGAIKAIYSQAHAPNPTVQAVIACSAPRLSYSAFQNSESQPRFFEAHSTAQEHVQQGRPDTLFQAGFPFPILITAAGYLDKYGSEERYNILRFLDRVPSPLLVTYGQLELERGGVAFAGMTDEVRSKRAPDQNLDIVTIPQADHVYTGAYEPLTQSVLDWLTRQFPG